MKIKKISICLVLLLCLFILFGCGNNSQKDSTYKFQNAFATIRWNDEYAEEHSELLDIVSHDFGDIISDGSETEFVLLNEETAYFQDSVLKKENTEFVLTGSELGEVHYDIIDQSNNEYKLDGQTLSLFFWPAAPSITNEMHGKESNNQFSLIQKSIVNAEIKEVEYTYIFTKE